MNVGLGFTALLGFLLFNIIQQTPFALSDMQQGLLGLASIVGIAVLLDRLKIFPTPPPKPPKSTTIVRTVVVEKEPETPEPPITPEAHLKYGGNPDAGGGR